MRNILWILVAIFGLAPDWETIFWCVGILLIYILLCLVHEVWSWQTPYVPKKEVKKDKVVKDPAKVIEQTKALMNLEYHKAQSKVKTAEEPTQPNPEEKIVKKI